MAHEVENMMYVGEKPWHGLGHYMATPPATIEEAIRLAGLDWTVSRVQLQLPDGTQVERWAVIRSNDGRVLGTVGADWRPIQNAKAFSPLQGFIDAGHPIESAGSLFQGERVWMLLKVNRPDAVIVPSADDRVSKYILAANGHDGTLAFTMGITPIRVVCNNTLSAALGRGAKTHFRIRHTQSGNAAVDALTATINEVDGQIEKAAEVFRALAGREIKTAAELRAYVDAVFPPAPKKPDATPEPTVNSFADLLGRPAKLDGHTVAKTSGLAAFEVTPETAEEDARRIFDKIEHLYEFGIGNRPAGVRHTAWAAYNAVTQYLTHERGRSPDTRLNNAWIAQSGPNARALPAAVDCFLKAAA
jgi:phage/plasmid-like protein (TIGR03299 family)